MLNIKTGKNADKLKPSLLLNFFIVPETSLQQSLPGRRHAGWMVGTMDLCVTVRTRLPHQKPVLQIVILKIAGVCGRRMSGRCMALLAQQWRALYEQCFMVAAMRVVTEAAVLGHRCVFPQVGAALLGMTGIAGIVDGRTGQRKSLLPL